ncbi:hypothetical protein CLI64_13300 [Nostoc sp. CENA543]|uniref:hypothetical protein n=1 Tax=Nostoc sp. CENA543 TaxID=1869241 RepID=UPI000CA14655|nr:hypothetical protein [Nostoc sp. CENA543]AUT01301.1 hypothetical protein CLI64_13300 [Nostoc sp. CENA543]
MILAQHSKTSQTTKLNNFSSWKLVQILQKLWWHTHAYGTVLSILLLTLISLVFTATHWSYHQLFSALQIFGNSKKSIETTEVSQ